MRYFAAAGDVPRDTLLRALELHEAEGRSPGTAVDLGCGGGRDALELLRRGWRVLAVDAEPAAIDLILGRATQAPRSRPSSRGTETSTCLRRTS